MSQRNEPPDPEAAERKIEEESFKVDAAYHKRQDDKMTQAAHDTTPPVEGHGPMREVDALGTLRAQGAGLVEIAGGLPAVTDENVHEANILRLKVTAAQARVDDFFKPRIAQANELHKGLLADWKSVRALPDRALAAIDGKLGPYLREKARIKREAEAAAAQAKADAEAKRRADEERVLLEAKALEDAGRADEAMKRVLSGLDEIKKTKPVETAPTPAAAPSTPGTTLRRTKRWAVVNIDLLPAEFKKLVADEEKIGAAIRAAEGDPGIPGVEVWWDEKPVKARF
jgi:hypothetical protein